MYCRECGKKLNLDNNYCKNCGAEIIREKTDTTKTSSSTSGLLLVISLLTLFGAMFINIFILPLAIIGIILSISKKNIACLVINIVSFILSIVVFLFIVALLYRIFSNVDENTENVIKDYYDKFEEYYKDYNDDDNKDVVKDADISGIWYLFSNNKIDDSTYYKFSSDNSFMYYVDNNVYVGTYTINKNHFNNNKDNVEYKLVLNVITLIKSDKTIVDSNLNNFSYSINVEGDTINARDLSDNTNFILKKDIKYIY